MDSITHRIKRQTLKMIVIIREIGGQIHLKIIKLINNKEKEKMKKMNIHIYVENPKQGTITCRRGKIHYSEKYGIRLRYDGY